MRRVVELGWTVGAPNGPLPLVMRLTGVRSLGRLMTRVPMNERMVRSMLAQIGLRHALETGRFPQEGVDWFGALLRHTNTMRNDMDACPPIIHPIRGMNDSILLTQELLRRVRVPVCFLWGADDPFGGGDVATRFVAEIPGAELEVVPDGGHAVWFDEPDRVAARTETLSRRDPERVNVYVSLSSSSRTVRPTATASSAASGTNWSRPMMAPRSDSTPRSPVSRAPRRSTSVARTCV